MQALIRRTAVLLILCLPVLRLPAQSSHGYTFHKLADANSVDSTGATLPGTANSQYAFTATNNIVAFAAAPSPIASTSGYCNAMGIFTMPINGGNITPFVSPSTQVEPSEPGGTVTNLCQSLAIWNGNIAYGANYTPTGGSLRNGYFYMPLAGSTSAASAEFFATGDTASILYNYTGTVTAVTNGNTTVQVPNPPSSISNPFLKTFEQNTGIETLGLTYNLPSFLNGNLNAAPITEEVLALFAPPITNFRGVRLAGSIITACNPPKTQSGVRLGYAENNSDSSLYAYNYAEELGSTPDQFFFIIGTNDNPSDPCPTTILYTPYTSTSSTYIPLPGQPAPTSGTYVQPAPQVSSPFISNSKAYFEATLTLNDGSNFTSIYQADPTNINTPIKIVSNRDALPGINPNPSFCQDGSAAVGVPSIAGWAYSQVAIVFEITQSIKNCSTTQTTSQGGIYAYNLGTASISTVLPLYTTASAANPIDTSLGVWPVQSNHATVDGHLLVSVINQQNAFGPSASTLYSLNLGQLSTTLTLTAPSTAPTTSPLTLTAQLTPSATSANTPAGPIHFYDGGTLLGDVTSDASGKATYSIATPTAGVHTYKSVYDGDPNFMGADSNTITITVTGNGAPDYTIAATPASQTIQAGQSATFTFTVTPINNFNQPISFSCSGLPTNAKCIFSPSTITPGTTNSTTLTVQTNVATTSSVAIPSTSKLFGGIALATLLPLLLFRRRRLPAVLLALVFSTTLIAFSGCGGSSSPSTTTTTTSSTTTPATPSGTSNITVTVGVTGGTSKTTSISLIIQ